MFSASYQLARVWGIPIRLHWSLAIALVYFAHQFSRQDGWLFGLLIGIGFFTSIVLHELGHSLVALRKGCRVRQITLMVVGGAAQMDRIPERPLDEFLMAIAGPLVSAILGGLGLFAAFATWMPDQPARIAFYLGQVNLGLAVFNMIPAFPMDGGRILRAALTPRFGRLRATGAAARLGQIAAIVGGILGLRYHLHMLVLVAIFIYHAAGVENRLVIRQEQARRGQRPAWPSFFGPPVEDLPAEDQVVISPPPYLNGPAQKADVRPEDKPPPWVRG
ncbi:MAG: site-2 protease family protein [Lentisphaerae bacterium]|nr:site-2 protease family protein [Lentisphaerota bacterium]